MSCIVTGHCCLVCHSQVAYLSIYVYSWGCSVGRITSFALFIFVLLSVASIRYFIILSQMFDTLHPWKHCVMHAAFFLLSSTVFLGLFSPHALDCIIMFWLSSLWRVLYWKCHIVMAFKGLSRWEEDWKCRILKMSLAGVFVYSLAYLCFEFQIDWFKTLNCGLCEILYF